ncbi:11193_t:CDS:2 [Dentiscutata erythropus]|uniref:11193_t:CDS:1 n=1 Tax=Dentiscutata erythropus TaxID=1348616 RepID=A0A9N9GTF8_9GLOM|nr:11193_t:CDS:2 [Dentiscutata erythropus]
MKRLGEERFKGLRSGVLGVSCSLLYLETGHAVQYIADNQPEETPISTTIVFEGSNVIEKIKKMVTSGHAMSPLPKCLVELYNSSMNYIEIVQQEN